MEHFIPVRRTDVINLCARCVAGNKQSNSDDKLNDDGREQQFREFAELLVALFHLEGHRRLEELKDAFAPVNPDRDTVLLREWQQDELSAHRLSFTETLQQTIQDANFSAITAQDLRDALKEQSVFKVRLAVDFDDFEEVLFYRRGESTKTQTVPRWWGLSRKTISYTNYDRVVVYVRFRDLVAPRDGPASRSADAKNDTAWIKGAVMLKLFQNVPKADLEMLFPNTEVRMKTIDKLAIGIPAAVSGVAVATTKLGTTLLLIGALLAFWLGFREREVVLDQAALLALGGGLGALGAYCWKQFSNFTHRKIRFMKALADNLYFKNLDNNVGVFHRLIDAAEEEECKEVLLAYTYLLTHGAMTGDEVDRGIEQWLHETAGLELDFELGDALAKLRRLGLLTDSAPLDSGEINLNVRDLSAAHGALSVLWRNAFCPRVIASSA